MSTFLIYAGHLPPALGAGGGIDLVKIHPMIDLLYPAPAVFHIPCIHTTYSYTSYD
jgi:hypothetical protein